MDDPFNNKGKIEELNSTGMKKQSMPSQDNSQKTSQDEKKKSSMRSPKNKSMAYKNEMVHSPKQRNVEFVEKNLSAKELSDSNPDMSDKAISNLDQNNYYPR